MPRIQGYERQYAVEGSIPNRQANTSDFGGSGLTEVGHGVQSLGQHAAYAQRQLQQASSQRAVTDVHTALSMFRGEFLKQAAEVERTADPSDTKLGERFLRGESGEGDPGSVKWMLDQYREKVEDPVAQQAFDRGAADLIEHFTGHFVRAQSRMAGEHAKQVFVGLVDRAQQDVERHPDVAPLILRNTREAVFSPEGSFARIPDVHKQGLYDDAERAINEYVVRGRIRENPSAALAGLQNGTLGADASAEKRTALIQTAETAIHAQEVERNRLLADQHRQHVELQHRTDQTLMAKYAAHQANPGNPQFPPLNAMEVAEELRAGRLDGGVGRAMLHMIDADSKERVLKSDNQTYWDLFGRIALPWGHKDKLTSMEDVYAQAAARKLTPANVQSLSKDFHDARTPEGLKLVQDRQIILDSFKTSITHSNPLLGKMDQDGDVNFGRFHKLAIDEEARAVRENRDPHEIYSEKSEFYIGNHAGKYRKTLQQSMKSVTNTVRMDGEAPTLRFEQGLARKPGETPAQYLERTRK